LWRLPPYRKPPAIDVFLVVNPKKTMTRAESAFLSILRPLIAETPFSARSYAG
jgi:hypothetical protein